MRFDRRTLVLRSMNERDAEKLCFQTEAISAAERETKVSWLKQLVKKSPDNINSKFYLTIEEKGTSKFIGIILGERAQYTMFTTVIIPDKQNILKHGYEAVDQFIKVCQEECPNLRMVKLNKDNAAAEIYLKKIKDKDKDKDKNKINEEKLRFGYVKLA